MIRINNFDDLLPSGKTLMIVQKDNGMYVAEVYDLDGEIEAATTTKTKSEIYQWLSNRGEY
jgi:hypothetical protein